MTYGDKDIITLLNSQDDKAIELLFDNYYDYLCNVVYRVINDNGYAEDLVQEMFFDLWKKGKDIDIHISLRAYLRRAAVNRSLNHLRKQRMKFDENDEAVMDIESSDTTGQLEMEKEEMEQRIYATIETLPPRCKIVFSLSRFENMSYLEIAKAMNISVKTVENQISKALKILRMAVQPYLA